jgi:tRNA (guanine-N7-)-methyltransferase
MTLQHALNKNMTEQPFVRRIKSYVLRQGRMTLAQQRAMQQHWVRWGIDYSGCEQSLELLFGRQAPVILEIGFGNGEQLLHAALNEPEYNHIGIEVHQPGVGRLLNALEANQCTNAKVYCHDAIEVLTYEMPDQSIDQVRIFFPDPWPKARHHKRRLVQASLLELLARKLRPGGILHLATDWQNYAEHMLRVLEECVYFKKMADGEATAPQSHERIATHFERRGLKLGHRVCDFLYRRDESVSC